MKINYANPTEWKKYCKQMGELLTLLETLNLKKQVVLLQRCFLLSARLRAERIEKLRKGKTGRGR